MLDLNRLRILRAVIATGSVSETARRLGYRPSTVSQHLHTLEKEVGFALVEHRRPSTSRRLAPMRSRPWRS